jgi:hypothetical protein
LTCAGAARGARPGRRPPRAGRGSGASARAARASPQFGVTLNAPFFLTSSAA